MSEPAFEPLSNNPFIRHKTDSDSLVTFSEIAVPDRLESDSDPDHSSEEAVW